MNQGAMTPISADEGDKAFSSRVASPPGSNTTVHTKSQPTHSSLPLEQALLSKGIITTDQLEIANRELHASNDPTKILGSILIDLGFITESTLSDVVSEHSGVQSIDLKTTILDSHLITLIPKDIAKQGKVVPISLQNNELSVAMADVHNILVLDQLKQHLPKNLKLKTVYAPESQIAEIIDQYYTYEMSIDGILKEIETGIIDKKELILSEGEGYVYPTVRLVDALLMDGIKRGVSDIHFEPEESFVRLRYRLDGSLYQMRTFHKEYWSAIVVRIKIMAKMNIAETRQPQDGHVRLSVLGRDVDFRVATQPTVHGENIVMRILDKKSALVPLEQLGYSEFHTSLLRKHLCRPEGIIVVTGPTGSGKTTTLYSILKEINSVKKNIMTLEDPVEYMMPMIRQTMVREDINFGFPEGVRSILRQDPDIIFIGEVRDDETATMAIRAAMTGHQVFTTLHTNDSIGAIPRFIDMKVPPSLLASNITCIIAQRLARRLCIECREPYEASDYDKKILGVTSNDTMMLYRHKGCKACSNTGYRGRITLAEILSIDPTLDEMIAGSASRSEIKEYAMSKGFRPMSADASEKVLAGITDIESILDSIDLTMRL